ncbi:MAG: ribose ABC transporter permease [Spirochaetaceae bacterium 4572_59]|nr:MAG: ribose ABC transporter permease [Spirochaetaceae bacterium 4572_59]
MNSVSIKNILKTFGIVIVLVVLVIFFGLSTDTFFKVGNLFNVARQVSLLGIVAVGMTFVMLTGGIDLSVGSILAVVGVSVAKMMVVYGVHPVAAVTAGMLIGTALGFLNGYLVVKIDIPPLIATLGMMTIARGMSFIITSGLPIYNLPDGFQFLGQGYIGVIPFPVIVMALVFFLGSVLLNQTFLGRYFYALGGNEEAARLSGIDTKKYKLLVYSLVGFMGSIAAILLLSRINSGQPTAGSGFELDVVTAVVLGGVSISGGEGKLSGVLCGVLIMGVLSNGLLIMNIGEYYQAVIKGIVLLTAVGFDRISKK